MNWNDFVTDSSYTQKNSTYTSVVVISQTPLTPSVLPILYSMRVWRSIYTRPLGPDDSRAIMVGTNLYKFPDVVDNVWCFYSLVSCV